jgi:hypothetical protein
LAREQEALAEETSDSSGRLASAAAFKLALDGAVAEMTRAARMLRERRTDEPVVRAETNAIRRFQQMIDAFAPRDKGKQDGQGNEGGGGGGGAGGGDGGDEAIRDIAELVLLKLMQEDVNNRTKELDGARNRGPLAPEQREEFQRLAEEQGRLADLLLEMAGVAAEEEDEKSPQLKPGDLKLDDSKRDDLKSEPARDPTFGLRAKLRSRGDDDR